MSRIGRPRSIVLPLDEVRKLAASGMSLRLLGEKYGCSIECMRKRMKEAGIPRQPRWSQPGCRNGQWKGGIQKDDDGYILIYFPSHPYATAAGYVREHRLAIESKLRRYLLPGEVVHHVDGDRANNQLSNLRLFATNADHLRHELTGRIPKWTADGLRRIQQGVLRATKNRRAASRKKLKSDARVSR